MRLLRLSIFLLIALPLYGQGARVGDGHTISTTKVVGALNVLVPVPNADINFCAYPNIGVPCQNLVTTYTDATLTTPCPTTTQVTLTGTDVCVSNGDAQGNWGVWVPAGNYSFTVSSSMGIFGPYYVTAGGTGGGGGGGNVSLTPSSDQVITGGHNLINTGALTSAGGGTVPGTINYPVVDSLQCGPYPAFNGLTTVPLLQSAVASGGNTNVYSVICALPEGTTFSPQDREIAVFRDISTFNDLVPNFGVFNPNTTGTAGGAGVELDAAPGMGEVPYTGNVTALRFVPPDVLADPDVYLITSIPGTPGSFKFGQAFASDIDAPASNDGNGKLIAGALTAGTGASQFGGNLTLLSGLKDSTGSLGTSGWFLSTDGTKTLWAPVTGGGGGVSSYNTRVGAVTAANNDYTFGQSSAAINSNAGSFGFSGNTFNASAAAHTSPAVTGTISGIPATCAVGEFYYATDATVGRTDYRCTATNTWTQVGWANQMTTIGDTQPGGAGGIPIRVAGVTSPDGLPYQYSQNSTAGVATTPVWRAPTYPERNITGTTATDTILSTDCWPKYVDYQGSVAVAVNLPTATTLGVNNCHFKLSNHTSGSATAVTVTPTTWTIQPGGASLAIAQGQSCDIYVSAAATRWDAECHDFPFVAGTNVTFTRGQNGTTITATNTGSVAFSAITGSTNTTAAMLMGTGSSLTTTGTGTINSTSVGGITVTGTPSVGQVLTATSTSAANWQAGGGGGSGTWSGLTLSGTNTGTAMILAPTSTAAIPLTINAPTGMTSDIFDVSLNSVRKFWIDNTGSMNFAGTNLNVGSSTSTTAAIVAAHGGNTTALPGNLQVYNNGDTINTNISATTIMGRASMQAGPGAAEIVNDFILKAATPSVVSTATYGILNTDFGNLINRTNAGAMTDTIPRAGNGTTDTSQFRFGKGWFVDYCVDPASVGSVSLTSTTSTIRGSASPLVLPPGACSRITSDGTNYKASISTNISVSRATIGVGNCASGVSTTWWNTALVAVCRTGSNIIESVLPFADADTAQIPQAIDLPADWTGLVDVKAIFSSPSTTGTVIFNVATSCAAANGTVTDDVAFNAADALSTVTLGGTANAQWAATKSGITTTGCAAGSTMQLKITRATDTAAGLANLKNIEVTLRRTNLI